MLPPPKSLKYDPKRLSAAQRLIEALLDLTHQRYRFDITHLSDGAVAIDWDSGTRATLTISQGFLHIRITGSSSTAEPLGPNIIQAIEISQTEWFKPTI